MSELSDYRRCISDPLEKKLREQLAAAHSKRQAAEALASTYREENANLLLQAQSWKMEAACHKSSLHEAYQAVTGATGEPGNWNGAKPIIEALDRLREENERLREGLERADAAEPFFRLAREVINPESGDRPWHADSQDWMVVFSFAGQSITLGDLRRAALTTPRTGEDQ